jgi:type IV secretion system protein TrbL
MARKWIERQVDEVLLVLALEAGLLYVRRRARRVLRKGAHGAAVVTGLGAGAVLGSVAVAAAAAAWYRRRARRSAALALPSASVGRGANGAGAPSAALVDPDWGGVPAEDAGLGRSSREAG